MSPIPTQYQEHLRQYTEIYKHRREIILKEITIFF